MTAVAGRAARRVRAADILTWPVVGRFLKWPRARLALQAPLFLIAALIIFDGFAGPQLPPKNLATVGVWLHYRGLVALVLLTAGNLFCMACPFMLPRRAGRWLRERLLGGGRAWPRWLRNKWLAVGLVGLFFFAYEYFDLWSTPWWTAWVAVAYFAVAFAVDTVFEGASFCKHVCPLGQFNFFGSLVSPWEIRVREAAVCTGCRTKDCIAAGPQRRLGQASAAHQVDGEIISLAAATRDARGCELDLFQPRKVGNMDCTFCLDCVHACPYDNVGLIVRTPTAELWSDPFRSGIGRFSQRRDLAVLTLLLVFGAYLNAFAMIRPVYGLQEAVAGWFGNSPAAPALALLVLFALGLLVLPALLLAAAVWATRAITGGHTAAGSIFGRYAFSLVPMGFAMWLAHYAFHFLTGALTVVPAVQSFLADVGLWSGQANWALGPLLPRSWLFPVEAVMLYAGAFGSIIVAFKIAQAETGGRRVDPLRVLGAATPWIALTLLLLGVGLWIMLQPMEMRGTMMMLTGG